jgi:hypothetical protein
MNWDQIEGKWKRSLGKVKEKWGKLTDGEHRRGKTGIQHCAYTRYDRRFLKCAFCLPGYEARRS